MIPSKDGFVYIALVNKDLHFAGYVSCETVLRLGVAAGHGQIQQLLGQIQNG
jgi:hypothetical protein